MMIHAVGQGIDHAVSARAECWEVTSAGVRSTLTFSLRHLVLSEIQGCFTRWGGVLILDREDLSRSSLTAWVDLGSIDTGSPERDEHIRSAEFFDVARFPLAELRSDTIAALDAQRFVVRGQLALHGVLQPVELIATPGPAQRDAAALRTTFDVQMVVDRQAFGLHWNQDLDVGGVVLGDRVELRGRVEATCVPGSFRPDRR